MATSPNFNWPEPDNTDLVKNGALAIRTAVNAIDSSLVDLKGGTTGQVLAKASGTDMDFSWVAQDDSNAIQNAIVDAKGDIIVATAADTPARLAVGTDGQVLKANSATATGLEWSADSAGMTNPMTTTGDTIYSSSGSTPARLGIGTTGQVLTVAGGVPSWATPASGGVTFIGADAKGTGGTQSISNATHTAITFAAEEYDTDGFHDNSSNTSRMTIPAGKGGYYQVNGFVSWDDNATGGRTLLIRKNGSNYLYVELAPSAVLPSQVISAIVKVVATDYLELFVYQTSTATRTVTKTAEQSRFNIGFLGA